MQINFQRGDIVIAKPEYPAGCYCILEVHANRPAFPYTGLNLVTLTTYQLVSDSLTKVGTATDEFLAGHFAPGEPEIGHQAEELRFRRGQVRAAHEAWRTAGDDRRRWQILASAKPGDTINVHYRGDHTVGLVFHRVVERGSKYVFVADDPDGRQVRFSLRTICLVQPAIHVPSDTAMLTQFHETQP